MRVLIAACVLALGAPFTASAAPAYDGSQAATPRQERILELLDRARTVDDIEHRPGYDRSCDPGACVFGEPWTDDHAGPKGHNGCTTREDVLLMQMKDIEMRWGSSCRIYEARLRDPYSGERMTWRDDGYYISIDHVYPLARAWHGGAWRWPLRKRVAFATNNSWHSTEDHVAKLSRRPSRDADRWPRPAPAVTSGSRPTTTARR